LLLLSLQALLTILDSPLNKAGKIKVGFAAAGAGTNSNQPQQQPATAAGNSKQYYSHTLPSIIIRGAVLEAAALSSRRRLLVNFTKHPP
jgi:hypothetical protein